jgi:hypothetical protein
MDAAAVGALVSDWPLHLFPAGDERTLKTCDFLVRKCFYRDALFHDLSHAGLNIYLTLAVGQCLLRAGDARWQRIVRSTRDLASPTGHWAEAMHPRTLCGSMGDGQHGWASAEFVLMTRNLFIREEGDELVLLQGLLPEWLKDGVTLAYGPTRTRFGSISVTARLDAARLHVHIEADYLMKPRQVVITPAGYRRAVLPAAQSTAVLEQGATLPVS